MGEHRVPRALRRERSVPRSASARSRACVFDRRFKCVEPARRELARVCARVWGQAHLGARPHMLLRRAMRATGGTDGEAHDGRWTARGYICTRVHERRSTTPSISLAIVCLCVLEDPPTMREVDESLSPSTGLVESGEERSTMRRGDPRRAREVRERATFAPPVPCECAGVSRGERAQSRAEFRERGDLRIQHCRERRRARPEKYKAFAEVRARPDKKRRKSRMR
jgi:hypothetical protein